MSSVAVTEERCHCVLKALGRIEHPERTCPVHKRVWARNEKVLAHVGDRLGETVNSGQVVLHLAPGGEIRKVEWRVPDLVKDLLEC